MGELVYQLKYRCDTTVLHRIVELLDKITGIELFDAIIPIPPTDKTRAFQPVTEIALALGERRGVTVRTDVLLKRAGGPQLKNVEDAEERKTLLLESLTIEKANAITGKNLLLVDDLFRSGATLAAATGLLRQAGARKVYVLTMTKTRSSR